MYVESRRESDVSQPGAADLQKTTNEEFLQMPQHGDQSLTRKFAERTDRRQVGSYHEVADTHQLPAGS
jgi:hypothetical protein